MTDVPSTREVAASLGIRNQEPVISAGCKQVGAIAGFDEETSGSRRADVV
jgi:hypothetical protein